jgi:hypothetical protein
VKTVLAEHDNHFTSHALQSMKKLDSFLKETLRVHPLSFGKPTSSLELDPFPL